MASPPTLTALTRLVGRRLPPTIALSFSAPMDPARAGDAGRYRLVSAGRDKTFGTRDDKALRFKAVAFDRTTNRVILTLRQLNLKQPVQLRVDGGASGGLTDLKGTPLDGDRDGQPGGDYVAEFRPSTLPRQQVAGNPRR
jgi:hypothetical protein